jgi:subtilisin family serine protease
MKSCPKKSLRPFFLVLSTIFCLTILSTPGWAGKTQADQIVVSLVPGTDIKAFNTRYGTTLVDRLPGTFRFLLRIAKNSTVTNTLSKMAGDPQILAAGPNKNYKNGEVLQRSEAFLDQRSEAFIDSTLSVNFYGQEATLDMHLQEAHVFTRGNGVVVAVIDTGIDFSHPVFAGRIATPYYDFFSNDTTPQDEAGGAGYGHGTFVAGLIALTAPGAKIMPLRAFASDGIGSSFDIARAIQFAVDNGADVINMSFGSRESDSFVDDAMNYASGKAFLVAAAGNDNLNQLHYPGMSNKTLCVAATDATDRKAAFSNYHRDVDASAPGVNIYSTYPGGRYATWSGTSFSTPLVSGQAALLLQLNLNLDHRVLSSIITSSGLNLDPLNPNYVRALGTRSDYLNAVNSFFSR